MTDEQLVDLMHLLTPEDHQAIAHILNRLVVLNDPDYTKLTPNKQRELDEAMKDDGSLNYEQLKGEFPIEDEELSSVEIKGMGGTLHYLI